MKENHHRPHRRGGKFWACVCFGLLFFCMLCYIICKLNGISEQIDDVDVCCEPFVVSDEICNEEIILARRDYPDEVNPDEKRIDYPVQDSLIINQSFFCNQVIVYFRPGFDKAVSEDYLRDSLGLEKVKECPNCDTIDIELWGRDGDHPILPEERGAIMASDVGTLNGGTVKTFNYVIELPIASQEVKTGAIQSEILDDSNQNDVLIALIDTGVDFNDNPKLTKYQWRNQTEYSRIGVDIDKNCIEDDTIGYDFVNNTTFVDDIDGHGSHIAGIISLYDWEISSDIKIMNLKIFHGGAGNLFNLICALKYAITNQADIINLSLGFYAENPPLVLKEIIQIAKNNGILVVASAGNERVNYVDLQNPNDHYPSGFNDDTSIDNIISVAALDILKTGVWEFSNFGKSKVEIAAPGQDISSTYKDGQYAQLSGTSMASGYITKVAAIKMKKSPTFNYLSIKNCIEASAVPVQSSRIIGIQSNKASSIRNIWNVLNSSHSSCN